MVITDANLLLTKLICPEKPIKITSHEIECFLAILLYICVFDYPSLDYYWHHQSRYSLVAHFMPVKYSGCYVLFTSVIISSVRTTSDHHFIPSTYRQSLEDVILAYKGTRADNLSQCIAKEQDKWGFKVFHQASSCGNVHLSGEEQMLPLGAKVVTSLCKTRAGLHLSVVFYDNYFTNFVLFQRLNSILSIMCIGTVRTNCVGGILLIADKKLVKEGSGACSCRPSDGTIVVKSVVNKWVNVLSNACRVFFPTLKWWSKDVPCPSLIQANYEHMRSIDLLIGYFPLYDYMPYQFPHDLDIEIR